MTWRTARNYRVICKQNRSTRIQHFQHISIAHLGACKLYGFHHPGVNSSVFSSVCSLVCFVFFQEKKNATHANYPRENVFSKKKKCKIKLHFNH